MATLRVIRAGEFFGELAVIAPGPRNATVVALDSVETLAIHKEQLDELRARRPAVEGVITNALVAEVRRLASALTEALYLPSEPRLIRRLLEVASLFGTRDEPAAVVPLSQEALAQLAGLTRPTANRILRRAEEQGLVRIGSGLTCVDAVSRGLMCAPMSHSAPSLTITYASLICARPARMALTSQPCRTRPAS